MEINDELTRLEDYKYKNYLFGSQDTYFFKKIILQMI